jgi:hypothetical protein
MHGLVRAADDGLAAGRSARQPQRGNGELIGLLVVREILLDQCVDDILTRARPLVAFTVTLLREESARDGARTFRRRT